MATPLEENNKFKDVSPTTKDKSIEDLFDSEGEQLSAVQYEKVLEKRVVFFSGASYKECPMLCFPTSGLRHLEGEPPQWEDLDSTLTYMKPLLSAEQLTNGIVMLVDGRRPNQSSMVKQLLERISTSDFPLKCHTLFLLKASHLAQLSSFTYYFSKQKTKLTTAEVKEKINIISIKDKEDLFEHVPQDQLTDDFGGTLEYDHGQWFKNAVLYEKVQRLREKILVKFPDVRDGLNQFEVPQTIKDAERLMQQHLKLKEFFVNLFAEIDVLIDELTTNLLNQPSKTTHSVAAAVATLPSTDVLAYLNSTNMEVGEEHAEFEKFWASHKQRLDHMMKVCHYKKSLEKVRFLMQGHIDDMTNGVISTGDTLESALELGEHHENFVSTCKEKMDGHLKDIREESVDLCNLPTADANTKEMLTQSIEGVKQGATSLTELYQKLMKLCQQKRDLYIVAVKFHMTIRQCDQWCASVKEFTEYPPSADATSAERAAEQIDQTDSLMKQMSQKNLNALQELGSCLPEKEVKKPVTKTIQKCKNGRGKLEEYKNKLLQIIALSYTPPTPPGVTPTRDQANSPSLSSYSKVPSLSLSSNSLTVTSPSLTNSIKSLGSDKVDAPGLTSPPSEYIDDESDPAILRKREFVYKEIVSTEKDYLADLKIILDSYYYEMDPEDRVPLRLRGKRGVVFGNLKQIYEFHNEVFVKQIEYYSENPERIGICFIQHSEQFQLYSEYCRNRPNSEALLVQSPECQSFFKEIQIRLAHQLPLNSYLIKPIQRITKYQLLLKDMIKYSSKGGQALTDLQTALGMMLKVLKNLNDSLHVVGLKGFPGALAEQGRLLVHDPFQVWEGAENARHRLSRNHDRHVFLFEKIVIFSKKKDESSQQRRDNKDAYFYKSHLHLSEVRIKELPDDGPLVFALSLIGGNRLTRLQASSKEIKQMWVSELKRLLSNQFGLLTDIVLQSGTLDRATAERFSKARGNTQGKSKLFDLQRDFEPKKSFSERFKLNILQKKKTSLENDGKPHSTLASKMSAPVTASLGGNAKLRVRDDNSLTTSVPSTAGKMRIRTKSHDNLLDDGVNGGGEENYYDTVHVSEEGEWSNEEEEPDGDVSPVATGGTDHYEMLAPGMPRYYIAIADYDTSDDDNGVPLTKGQEVELIGINQYSGWWWVRSCNYYSNDEIEGWAPASYLQMADYN